MEKKNKAARLRSKKEEVGRIRTLVGSPLTLTALTCWHGNPPLCRQSLCL